jgi:hypothetical protein
MPESYFGNVPSGEARRPDGEYISRTELEALLEERDKKHAEAMAEVRAKLPVAMVPAHSGGPGIDQHQKSWSLAEQEAAARGEMLDHWEIRE